MISTNPFKRTLSLLVFVFGLFGVMACNEITTEITTVELPSATNVENFTDYDSLKAYLTLLYDETDQGYVFKNAGSLDVRETTAVGTGVFAEASNSADTIASVERTHSESNFQVDGVKETDTVLTDGYHIYICTWQKFIPGGHFIRTD